MIFTGKKFEEIVDSLMIFARETLLPIAKREEIVQQRINYDKEVDRVAGSSSRELALKSIGEFVADEKEAERMANSLIEVAIGNRLKGALACFEAGKDAECARLCTFVLAEIFAIIGRTDGSAALFEATSGILLEHSQRHPDA